MTVAGDRYCLVPRDDIETFVDLARANMATAAPDYSRSDNCTGIISLRHFVRLEAMRDEAHERHVDRIDF